MYVYSKAYNFIALLKAAFVLHVNILLLYFSSFYVDCVLSYIVYNNFLPMRNKKRTNFYSESVGWSETTNEAPPIKWYYVTQAIFTLYRLQHIE